jgi:hypothetical protein
MEDFLTFCPQCRAPQIRVVATVPAERPVPRGVLRRVELPAGSKIDWWSALPAIILAMLVAALITVALVGSVAIGLLICGVLSVFFYRQRNKMAQITRWVGARLGAASGILSFGIVTAALSGKLGFHKVIAQILQMALDRTPDPAARQNLQDMVSQHPHAFVVSLVISAIMIFLMFTSLGGVIGAALVNRWRPALPMTSSDPETQLDHHEKTERSDHD